MVTKLVKCLAAAGLVTAMAAPAFAHHSFAAEFDAKAPGEAARHRSEDGMDQPALVDPHRREGSGDGQGRALDD